MMIQSAVSRAKFPKSLEFCIYLDIADQFELNFPNGPKYKIFYGPKTSIPKMYNFLYSQTNGKIIMYGSDDIIFRSNNWDILIQKEFLDPKIWLICGNDLSPNSHNIATHGFVKKEKASKLSYLLPPYFSPYFVDTYITKLAKASNGFKFVGDLVIEHMHPDWNKSVRDSTYPGSKRYFNYFICLIKYKMSFIKFQNDLSKI